MTQAQSPKLLRVTCAYKPNGKVLYTGLFEGGTKRVLRTSAHSYITVAQIGYGPTHGGPAFVFCSKLTATAPKYGTIIAQVPVGLGPGELLPGTDQPGHRVYPNLTSPEIGRTGFTDIKP